MRKSRDKEGEAKEFRFNMPSKYMGNLMKALETVLAKKNFDESNSSGYESEWKTKNRE